MTPVYHHTDSARLPWILRDQALKPGSNRIGDYPDDFLWATTDPMGDSTASSAVRPTDYRDGHMAAVRFTLPADAFTPWSEIKAHHPSWGPHHFATLERAALEMGASPRQIAQWRCRTEPLTADHWLAVEFRTWRNPRWRPVQTEIVQPGGDALGVQLDGVLFYSRQIVSPERPTAYHVGRRQGRQAS